MFAVAIKAAGCSTKAGCWVYLKILQLQENDAAIKFAGVNVQCSRTYTSTTLYMVENISFRGERHHSSIIYGITLQCKPDNDIDLPGINWFGQYALVIGIERENHCFPVIGNKKQFEAEDEYWRISFNEWWNDSRFLLTTSTMYAWYPAAISNNSG